MRVKNKIPVIDLFAGPGGLGEGFSSVLGATGEQFEIKLSIEKDRNAHHTLELRSFVHQFDKDNLPELYYTLLREPNLEKRDVIRKQLFNEFPLEAEVAKNCAWLAELGSEKFPEKQIDQRIASALGETKNWVLIGGPPCQAFSLVGRSRVGGISNTDHRVHLYKEYLRIIAKHHPAVFVMENVKGLLSAKVDDEKVFHWMLRDLQDPNQVFHGLKSPKYRIYSLVTPYKGLDDNENPIYENDTDFLIKSEKYFIPQRRHRVILLGVRSDIKIHPGILSKAQNEVSLDSVIGDLPKIRSAISRKLISNGKSRSYQNIIDNDSTWKDSIESMKKKAVKWIGFEKEFDWEPISVPKAGKGSEFIPFLNNNSGNPLKSWYADQKLKGVCNHESRAHLESDLQRYLFYSIFTDTFKKFPRIHELEKYNSELVPDHQNVDSGKFSDRFRVQLPDQAATTVTSHISKDGHYFIHYDPEQCRSLTVREAARIQTFPDNYLFCGSRTAQFHQVGNAVPPFLAKQIGEIVIKLIKS